MTAINELWLQRNAWARTAREGKNSQQRARKFALWLAVSGAFLGSIAPLDIFDSIDLISKALAIISAMLLGWGGYLGRELLTPERETNWARARIQASRISALVSIYQETATKIRFQIAQWKLQAASRKDCSVEERQKAIIKLVERCEAVIAQENKSWKAEWLSREKVKRVISEMKKVNQHVKL